MQKTLWQRIAGRLAGSKSSFPMAVINNAPISGLHSKQAEFILKGSSQTPGNSVQPGAGIQGAHKARKGGLAASKQHPKASNNEATSAELVPAMWGGQEEGGYRPQAVVPPSRNSAEIARARIGERSMDRQPIVRLDSAAEQRMCEFCPASPSLSSQRCVEAASS